jgi:hypothetical protein
MSTIEELVAEFGRLGRVPEDEAAGPLALGCSVGPPADPTEVAEAWAGEEPPAELLKLWAATGTAKLFEDLDYGQWGLRTLTPREAAARSALERESRPGDYPPGDIVFGEFLGDQELLVVSAGDGVLVALPLDDRVDWYRAAPNIADFLDRYLAARGQKYWE